jgi:hypothetical protein
MHLWDMVTLDLGYGTGDGEDDVQRVMAAL